MSVLTHSRHGDNAALACFGRGTPASGVYPAARRTADETLTGFQSFAGSGAKVKLVYSDNSNEVRSALAQLGWRYDTPTPIGPRTTGSPRGPIAVSSTARARSFWQADWSLFGGARPPSASRKCTASPLEARTTTRPTGTFMANRSLGNSSRLVPLCTTGR